MIQGVIFDMDGVLADTEYFYQQRREAYLERMDFPGPRGLDFIGSNEKAIWETLVPDDEELRREMMLGYRAYRRFHPEDYARLADPAAAPLFRELKRRGIRIGIASSSARGAIQCMTEAAGIAALTDNILSGEDCAAHKPDPEIYLRSLAALGLEPGQALAVEDSSTGIAAGRAAGLTVLALRPRHGEKMDQRAAQGIIERLEQVLDYLG